MHWDCKRSGGRFRSLKADCIDFSSAVNKEALLQIGYDKEHTESEENPVEITASFDAGWQRRESGRSYNSLSGHSCFIGCKSGKILDYQTRIKKCRICQEAEKRKVTPQDHDCMQKKLVSFCKTDGG